MITYTDDIVCQIMTKLEEQGLEKNTLVLFTGDNGTNKAITSKLPGMDLRGGKGSMTEAGTRVPRLAWWPGKIEPGVRDEMFCLVDVLPTIAAVAGIELSCEVDGMDLSHNLLGGKGQDRNHVLMSFKKEYFVRDKRFRLDQGGTPYDTPATSDKERYSEKETLATEHHAHRERLQSILNEYMAIDQEFFGAAESKKKKRSDAL